MTILHGLDTETPEANVALVATENEWIEPHSFDDIARFVMQAKYRTSIFFTFNLRFDAQAILKLLPEDLQSEIWYTNNTEYNGWFIKYIDRKFLRIRKNKNSANIYDIAPYYQGHSLDSASKQFLGEKKLDTIDRKKLGESFGYYAANHDEIIKYCMHDAWLTKELGEITQKDFVKLGFGFDRPLSTANIMGRWIKKNTTYPKRDIWDRHLVAFLGYRGGRFETRQRGLFEKTLYDYDINSAFPSTMIELPNWGNGEFVNVLEPQKENEYGWYMCQFDCPHIPYVTKQKWTFTDYLGDEDKITEARNNKILYPIGSREACVTKLEYNWMKKYGYPCEFLGGVEWEETQDKYKCPFAFVGDLYERRKEIKHDPKQFSLQYNMKIAMNASYGKTGEYKNGFGIIQNFYYATYITAVTRMRMASVIQEHPGAVVNVAADGILSQRKIPELKISKELGDWEVNEYDGGVVVGSGILQLFGENGKTKARGITDRRNWDLIGELEKNRNKEYVTYTRHSPASLGMVLSWPKVLKMNDLNRFLDFSRRLYVNSDGNHIWERVLKNWDEFLENKGVAKPYDWRRWESENLPRK